MKPSPDAFGEVVNAAVARLRDVPGALLPVLHAIQGELGCIPAEAVPLIGEGLGLSRAEVHGVITFYHDFRLEPKGRTTIHVCRAEACQAMGSRALETHVQERLGVEWGGTTEDGLYTLEPVYCLGNCACSPSVRIGDDVHARVTPERFDELLDGVDT